MDAAEMIGKYFTLTPEFAFFYAGPVSQWWYSPFEVDGVVHNCAEQRMMAAKASLFGDKEALSVIMTADGPFDGDQKAWNKYPRAQQAAGRSVKGFEQRVWDGAKFWIVTETSVAKFSQNKDLLAVLSLTGGRTIVEASPVDRVWGIGLSRDDPAAMDPARWKGENLLGKALTAARDRLLSG